MELISQHQEEGWNLSAETISDVPLSSLFLKASGDGNTTSVTGNLVPAYSHASIILLLESAQPLNPPCCSASNHLCTVTMQFPPLSHTVFTDATLPQLAYENATGNRVRDFTEVKLQHLTFSVSSAATRSIKLSSSVGHDFFLTNPHWLLLTTVLFFSACKA